MSGSFDVIGDNVIITFEYVADMTKGQLVISDASHYLWNHGDIDRDAIDPPKAFSELTNQERLDIVDVYIRKIILDLAKEYSLLSAQEDARKQSDEDASVDYEL